MDPPNIIKGQCHCGNIHYQLSTQLNLDQLSIRKCTCSFCTMHGGVYTSDPDGELHFTIQDKSQINKYRFGHQTAEFMVCKTCGVLPFVISEIDGKTQAVVNVNTAVDPIVPTDRLVEVDYDGEVPEDRLARRGKNWIGKVIEE